MQTEVLFQLLTCLDIEVDFKTCVLKHSKNHSNVSQSMNFRTFKILIHFFFTPTVINFSEENITLAMFYDDMKLILEKIKILRRCFTAI